MGVRVRHREGEVGRLGRPRSRAPFRKRRTEGIRAGSKVGLQQAVTPRPLLLNQPNPIHGARSQRWAGTDDRGGAELLQAQDARSRQANFADRCPRSIRIAVTDLRDTYRRGGRPM